MHPDNAQELLIRAPHNSAQYSPVPVFPAFSTELTGDKQ